MISLVIVLLSLSCLLPGSHADPHYANLRLVDSWGGNFIFRGPQPQQKVGVFDYDNLVEAFNNQTAIPKEFTLLDISLLNPNTSNEAKDMATEIAYFKDNPSKGRFLNWPILRASQDPFNLSDAVVKVRAVNLSQVLHEDLPSIMGNLSAFLHEKVNPPLVVYFHSEGGTDRAGEVAASYYMQFLNKTLAEATNYNLALPGGEPDQYCINAQSWYCFHLKYALNYAFECSLK